MLTGWASGLQGRISALTPLRAARSDEGLDVLCDRLLAPWSATFRQRTALAIHTRFVAADDHGKRDFMTLLGERYNADAERLEIAIAAYRADPSVRTLADLHAMSEPRRQQILRRLNEVPGGTAMLLAMRAALFRIGRNEPGLAALDGDFAHLFGSWFNGGFLELRRLDWSTPGEVLTNLMRYEAVHAIESWEALRARLEPCDRRCYAFFHPSMGTTR